MKPKSAQEIEAVLRLDGPERFRHFVKQVVDWEQVWGLWDEGWAIMKDGGEALVCPLWPAHEYAMLLCVGEWAEYRPKAIPLIEFLEDYLPNFRKNGILPGVFPTPTGKGVTPTPDELAEALRDYKAMSYD